VLFYSADSYVYLIPALIGIAAWIGLGCRWIVERAPESLGYARTIAAGCIAAMVVVRAILGIPAMNLSADRSAEQYARSILDSAPTKAIVFAEGDEATFSLWYAHFAYRVRPDVSVISSDLLIQPWYHDVLRATYPALTVSDMAREQDIIQQNPERPVCRAGAELQATSQCAP